MRICVVNSPIISQAFQGLGHDVLDLRLDPGPQDICVQLTAHGFEPELLLDVEILRSRTILMGLGGLTCKKVFWSVDTHLNAWWHRAYGRMFDLVLTTQDSWIPVLNTLGLGQVRHLPWYGRRRSFRPWAERTSKLCFVGRITPERAVRQRMVDYLCRQHGLQLVQDAGYSEMLDHYDNTWLVPNESIFSEINFRLFEAASCGCLVLNQEVSSDIYRLFEPGREVEVYSTIVELDVLVRRNLANPDRAGRMGRAAWARVQAEHLPQHRAERILELAESATGAVGGDTADSYAWEAVFRLNESGMFNSDLRRAADGIATRSSSESGVAALVRCLDWDGRKEEALGLAAKLVAEKRYCDSFEINLTGSGLALRHGEWNLAKAFWLRHEQTKKNSQLEVPKTPFRLWLLWATECERHWMPVRSGVLYDTSRGIPESAADCLMEANTIDSGNLDVAARMNSVLTRQGSGGDGFRLHVLSHLGLHRPEDWRLGLELALVNLRAMRLDEGLQELQLAGDVAAGKGEMARFLKVLASRDPQGLLAGLLADKAPAEFNK
ncbi:MAG: glycosyltransferase [Proteobacteria bacterium]|nr:glycosyltransferase [Pseudomonadota bacterium]